MNEWKLLSFVLSSSYRRKIMIALAKGPSTPKDLSVKTGLRIAHVSLVLKQLREKDLVICRTPEVKKGKIYTLTKKGEMIIQKIC